MTHIRGNVNQVTEVLKIAYTAKISAFQNTERWVFAGPVPPGGMGYTRETSRGKTGVVKWFEVSALNNAILLRASLHRTTEPTLVFGSYLFNRQNWEVNDAIIPEGDQLIVELTNPTGADIYYTFQVTIVDAEGVLT